MLKTFIILFIFENSYVIIIKNDKGEYKMKVTKDTVIGTILDTAPQTAPYFLEMGMHCLGCPSARSETIEQACLVHGVNADELVEKINAAIGE